MKTLEENILQPEHISETDSAALPAPCKHKRVTDKVSQLQQKHQTRYHSYSRSIRQGITATAEASDKISQLQQKHQTRYHSYSRSIRQGITATAEASDKVSQLQQKHQRLSSVNENGRSSLHCKNIFVLLTKFICIINQIKKNVHHICC